VLAGLAVALLALPLAALAGPVDSYRDGPRYCPKDRSSSAQRIDALQAVERARGLLPDGFCGPSAFVSGCEFDPEQAFDTWRVFVHQYKLIDGRRVLAGGDHTYVVLDAVGNCLANIPGTPLGARS
jgi:hypothetical protein